MEVRNIVLIATALLTLRAGFKSKKARSKLEELVTNKRWLINFIIIMVFVGYIVYVTKNDNSDDAEKTKEALKKALLAFMIALFAEFGLTIAPFWLVFTLAYYMEGWI